MEVKNFQKRISITRQQERAAAYVILRELIERLESTEDSISHIEFEARMLSRFYERAVRALMRTSLPIIISKDPKYPRTLGGPPHFKIRIMTPIEERRLGSAVEILRSCCGYSSSWEKHTL